MCTKCPARPVCKEEFSSKSCNQYRSCLKCPGKILCKENYGSTDCIAFKNLLSKHAAHVAVNYLRIETYRGERL